MAMPLPSWLRPADPAAHVAQGIQMGSQIEHQKQALDLEQQRMDQQHLMEQQRLEIEKSYRQQQAGLAKQQLAQAQQMNQAKIQQAARMMQEQAAYQADLDSGMDQYKALSRHPGMMAGAGYGSALRSAESYQRANTPESLVPADDSTGIPAHVTHGGRPYFPPGAGASPKLDPNTALQGSALRTAYSKALEDLSVARQGGKKNVIKSAQENVDSLRSQIEQLGKPAPAAAPTGSLTIGRDASGKLVLMSGGKPASGSQADATPERGNPEPAPLPADLFPTPPSDDDVDQILQ